MKLESLSAKTNSYMYVVFWGENVLPKINNITYKFAVIFIYANKYAV